MYTVLQIWGMKVRGHVEVQRYTTESYWIGRCQHNGKMQMISTYIAVGVAT